MRRIWLCLCLITLSACTEPTSELRIGSNRWLGYGPIYLADDYGWLEASHIHLVEYPSTTSVLRSLRSGVLDAGLLTLDEALKLHSEGYDLEIVLIADLSNGADALYVNASIGTPEQLRGRRIGVENTALGAYFLSRFLDEQKLNRRDIQVVDLPVHEQVQALREHRVDAVITFASYAPELTQLGAKLLFDSRQLPDEIIDVLVVRRDLVSPERRQALRTLWYEALNQWQEHPKRNEQRLTRRLGINPQGLRLTLAGLRMGDAQLNQQWFSQGQLLEQSQQMQEYLMRVGQLHQASDPRTLQPACSEQEPC